MTRLTLELARPLFGRGIDVDDLEVLGQVLGLDGELVHLLMRPPEQLAAVYRDRLIPEMRRKLDAMDPSPATAPLRDHLRRWEDWASREPGTPGKGQGTLTAKGEAVLEPPRG